MSRVYFHSPSGGAELRGSERAWLRSVAGGPAESAWALDGFDEIERASAILGLVPEGEHGGANYLHRYLREAADQDRANKAAYKGWQPGQSFNGPTSHEPQRRLIQALRTCLAGSGLHMVVAGVELHTSNIVLNTALVAGSDPVRLAAKIDSWCESHAWVEGPDRAWMADIIDQGLKAGIYRRGLWYSDAPDGPKDKWSDQGWGQVLDLLRSRDDEPVVLSYSVTDRFPNRDVAGWEPSIDRQWRPDWADGDGANEWEAMTAADQESDRSDHANDQWYELPADQQWQKAMDGLRQRRPWAQLAPDTLAEVAFHLPVTVYDLFAPDRDERVRTAAALDSEPSEATR